MTTQYIQPNGTRTSSPPPATVDRQIGGETVAVPVVVYALGIPEGGPLPVESALLSTASEAIKRHNSDIHAPVLAAASITLPTP